MAKVIGLSGPQGGGKTTLLEGLRKNHGYYVDDYKVSRDVQHHLGWDSLDNVMESPCTMMKFQTEVLERKSARDFENMSRSEKFVLTERTFADIASYTQLWSWNLVAANKWNLDMAIHFLTPFVARCAQYQRLYAGNILLPYMSHVKFVGDPHRAGAEDIEFISNQVNRFIEIKMPRSVPVLRITKETIEDRIAEVHNWILTI